MIVLTEENILDNGYFCCSNTGKLSSELHSHEFYEFVAVVSGRIIHTFGDAEHEMNMGDFACVYPGREHKTSQRGGGAPPMIISLSISREMWRKWTAVFPDEIPDGGEVMTLSNSDLPDIKASFDALHSMDEAHKDARVSAIAAKFFASAAEYMSVSSAINGGSYLMKKALMKMKEPKYLQGGMKSLVDLTGYSRSHLYKLFPEICSVTPHEYITELRLRRSENLLRCTDMSVLDVSMECGFSSVSHFIKLFKKTHGALPTAFRENKP